MDGYATAGPSTSPPQQLSPPIALTKRTSSRNALRDTFQENARGYTGSPPSTPPPRNRKTTASKKKDRGKQPLKAYASHDGRLNASRNPGHSHGLSWSSTTKDSVVDNLLFSLDNLSRQDFTEEDVGQNSDFDPARYRFSHVPALSSSRDVYHRTRSHTHSSSLSSGYDRRAMADSSSTHSTSTKGRRSNSSSSFGIYNTSNGRIKASRPSDLSRTSSETQRPSAYMNGSATTKEEDEADDMDYRYLMPAERLGRNRRSLSMDQLYSSAAARKSMMDRGRPVPSVHSKYEVALDAAPEPMIAAGPRKQQNPTATGPVYVNQAPKHSLRKITTQTDMRSVTKAMPSPPIPQNIRNQASEFVRANSMRGVPPIPGQIDTSKPLPSPGMQASQKSANSPRAERPGFFKRVFGGSSTRSSSDRVPSMEYGDLATAPVRTSSTTSQPQRTGTRQTSKEHPSTTSTPHPPPTLTKKPSSFFRRRKKSTSDSAHPPPLPLGANNLNVTGAEPSPSVSSLRKVMDPYIGENNTMRQRTSDAAPVSKTPEDLFRPATESSAEESDNLDIFHSGYSPPPDASLSSRHGGNHVTSANAKQTHEQDDSPQAKMKIKKRKPEPLTKAAAFLGAKSSVESAAVSPISNMPSIDDKENQRPVSRASTGDRIIASATPVKSLEDERELKLNIDTNIRDKTTEDSFLLRPNTQDRPDSKKSERLLLKPTVSEEYLHFTQADLAPVAEASYDGSNAGSVKSPGFHTASSSTFPASVQSPITPSTQYHSATSLPLPSVQVDGNEPRKSVEANGMNFPSAMIDEGAEYRERARKIFEGDEEDVTKAEAASWLGEYNTLSTRTLEAYMRLFHFSGVNMLAALRALCGKLVLKGETQQFDRIITALSARWCECNPNHGFKAQDVVHTILYSLILLNTDLHLADIGEKMSRGAYVKNTLPTIRRVVADAAPNAFDETIKPATYYNRTSRPTLPWSNSNDGAPPTSPSFPPNLKSPSEQTSFDHDRAPTLSKRMSLRPGVDRANSDGWTPDSGGASNALVSQPWTGPMRGWEFEVETVLKSFFASIKSDPLPLFGAPSVEPQPSDRTLSVANLTSGLKRSGSVVSRAPSDTTSFRSKPGFRTMTMGFQNRYNRSRPKLNPPSTLGGSSSRTSFDDGNSVWSPAQSSNWSKYSYSKTLTSASMQSLGQHYASPTQSEFKHSIGFANALSQAIIREEHLPVGAAGSIGTGGDNESVSMSVPGGLLEDESLALEGAPWAKEGLVKHKHHLETPGKKAKERSWNDCFAVISKGKLTLFAFNTSTKSMSFGRKTLQKQQSGGSATGRASSVAAPKVGGGDWMENAEQLDVFVLRQTIASTLPPPGYSKTRQHVWALSLPTGAVHLFQVGTPEIAQEFMSSANYWSARLSKEPLSGGVSNIEYGWSDQVINPALLDTQTQSGRPNTASPPPSMQRPPSSMQTRQQQGHMHTGSGGMPKPSFQSSMRGSFDAGFGPSRGRLPGDKAQLSDWHPPSQSMMASQLMEVDQLKALTAYVSNVEDELAKHNELKSAIELAFSPRAANYNRAMTNWQRKSDYLLREIVKFQTYVDGLTAAQNAREAVYARKNGLDTTRGNAEVGNGNMAAER